jgi:pyruvate dehydrogenase E1 component beta subunit
VIAHTQAAIRDPNPVVFLESEIGYNETYELSPEAQSKDFVLDIGKAHIEREGSDITVLTFSRMVGVVLEAAQKAAEKGINVEVVNLRSLRPLDLDTIINSIKKTNRFVTVEEGWPQCGVGSEIIALANERTFSFSLCASV